MAREAGEGPSDEGSARPQQPVQRRSNRPPGGKLLKRIAQISDSWPRFREVRACCISVLRSPPARRGREINRASFLLARGCARGAGRSPARRAGRLRLTPWGAHFWARNRVKRGPTPKNKLLSSIRTKGTSSPAPC